MSVVEPHSLWELTKQELQVVLAMRARAKPTIMRIQEAVADHFGVDLTEMVSQRRSREVARPRQVAMLLSRELTEHSLPVIGRCFGDRDHTTVIHAVRQIKRLCAADATLAGSVERLRAQLAEHADAN